MTKNSQNTSGTAFQTNKTEKSLIISASRNMREAVMSFIGKWSLFLVAALSIVAIILIFVFVGDNAVPFLKDMNLKEFLCHNNWHPTSDHPEFGALASIVGTVYVTLTSLLIAVPIGILTAIFLSDMVNHKTRNIVKPIIEILAAIPSVAYGFFAVKVFAPWLQREFNLVTGTNALNASMVLSIMALPTIISVAEDAISNVPRELREASYGLGSTRFETLFKVVVPAAHSGIIAAVILGMMRSMGETMIVWMAAGNAHNIPTPWWDLAQSVRAITATIAGELLEAAHGTMHYHSLFALAVLLLAVTFVLNLISEFFLSQAKKIK